MRLGNNRDASWKVPMTENKSQDYTITNDETQDNKYNHIDVTNGNIGELVIQIKALKNMFTDVMLVNPIEKKELEITSTGLRDSNKSCKDTCPLRNDTCGCICNDTASNSENRSRFVYNKNVAFFVMSRLIKMRYRDYVLVMVMRLNPTFSFGAFSETQAIDNITKVSSNLVIDPLTQIFNRQYYYDNIGYLMKQCSSQGKPLCLANIDVDNFKKFNDTYGHDFGDKVLKKVAELMSKSITNTCEGYPIRMGGDEFMVLGVGVEKQRFKAIMNKLCIMVDDCKLPYNNQLVSIKISIGVSEMLSDNITTSKQLYEKADQQLYCAKEAGKGCVR